MNHDDDPCGNESPPAGAFRLRGMKARKAAGAGDGSSLPLIIQSKVTLTSADGSTAKSPSAPIPLGAWDFASPSPLTLRSDGELVMDAEEESSILGQNDADWNELTLEGARVTEEGLEVARDRYASTTLRDGSGTIGDKTLVAFVEIQRMEEIVDGSMTRLTGSALTLQNSDGRVFDGLVYRDADREGWIAGSNGHLRTELANRYLDVDWTMAQMNGVDTVVRIAAVYQDTTVTLYQDTTVVSRQTIEPVTFDKAHMQVVLGWRTTAARCSSTSAPFIDAFIKGALLYDRALTLEELPVWS